MFPRPCSTNAAPSRSYQRTRQKHRIGHDCPRACARSLEAISNRSLFASRLLVGWSILPSLGNMPEDAGWVGHVSYAQSPWLQCRCLWGADVKFRGQIKSNDMVPPSVEVVDH